MTIYKGFWIRVYPVIKPIEFEIWRTTQILILKMERTTIRLRMWWFIKVVLPTLEGIIKGLNSVVLSMLKSAQEQERQLRMKRHK